jgi:hypothetical protein
MPGWRGMPPVVPAIVLAGSVCRSTNSVISTQLPLRNSKRPSTASKSVIRSLMVAASSHRRCGVDAMKLCPAPASCCAHPVLPVESPSCQARKIWRPAGRSHRSGQPGRVGRFRPFSGGGLSCSDHASLPCACGGAPVSRAGRTPDTQRPSSGALRHCRLAQLLHHTMPITNTAAAENANEAADRGGNARPPAPVPIRPARIVRSISAARSP